MAIDITPLRTSRDFRLLYFGQAVSFVGSMITYVAVPFQVFRLTHSSLAVGLLGLAQMVPLVVAALVGGVLADTRERRRMLQICEVGLLLTSAVLVANASLGHPQLWVLYAVSAAAATLDGIQRPSLDAMVPRLVSQDEVPAAAALTGLRGTIGMIGGPALAGLLLATIGLAGTYLVDVLSFAASLTAIALIKAMPPPADAPPPSLRSVADGFRYARSRQELLGSYLVDMNAMFFGMPDALFPALAVKLGGGPGTLGLLFAAPAIGAFAANLFSGWTTRIARHGLAIALAATAWGLAIVAFGVATSVVVAFAFLVVAGAADMVSGLFRMTLWNQTVPDHLRGRLAGIEMLSYTSGPNLGNVEAGAVGAVAGIRASIVSGGILSVVGSLGLLLALPGLRRYRFSPAAAESEGSTPR